MLPSCNIRNIQVAKDVPARPPLAAFHGWHICKDAEVYPCGTFCARPGLHPDAPAPSLTSGITAVLGAAIPSPNCDLDKLLCVSKLRLKGGPDQGCDVQHQILSHAISAAYCLFSHACISLFYKVHLWLTCLIRNSCDRNSSLHVPVMQPRSLAQVRALVGPA